MNTTENNKLLAEFIGAEVTDLKGKQKPIYYPILGASHTKLKFHSDWNWLMLVVDKINSLEDIALNINKSGSFLKNKEETHFFHIVDFGIESFNAKNILEATYNTCVEFVKWYNKN